MVAKKGEISYKEFCRLSQSFFPNGKDFEGILSSFVRAGQVVILTPAGGEMVIKYIGD